MAQAVFETVGSNYWADIMEETFLVPERIKVRMSLTWMTDEIVSIYDSTHGLVDVLQV